MKKAKKKTSLSDPPPVEIVEFSTKPKGRPTPAQRDLEFVNRPKFAGKTDEEILGMLHLSNLTHTHSLVLSLDIMHENWTSPVYQHFHKPLIIEEENIKKYVFTCRIHPSKTVTRARYDTTTSNLTNHVNNCEGKLAPRAQQITTFTHSGPYNKGAFRYWTAMWTSLCGRPFAIIKDKPLHRMFEVLNASVEPVSAQTVSRDVQEAYDMSFPLVKKYFEVSCVFENESD